MTSKSSKIERIQHELHAAHVTSYGMIKQESRFLHNIIEDNEHVKAVVYGLYGESGDILQNNSGMLVATDKRIVFIDRKPLFVDIDELGYEAVIGINVNQAPIFSALELHTARKEYHFRNVNKKCAKHFAQYIESRIVDISAKNPKVEVGGQADSVLQTQKTDITTEAIDFLRAHDVAVLSTINADEQVDTATIYYMVDRYNNIYFLTKSSTAKAHNLAMHSYVALTIFDEPKMSTMQIKGICNIVSEPDIQNYVYSEISKPREYGGVEMSVPVTKIKEGGFVTFCVTMTDYKYRDYRDKK